MTSRRVSTVPNDDAILGIDESLGILTNVSSVDISGIELELRASPWDNGFVSLDLGTLTNKYSSFEYPDPSDPSVTIDQSGNVISDLTPDWTMTVGVEHAFTLANGASITPRVNIYSSGAYDFGADVDGATGDGVQPAVLLKGWRPCDVPAGSRQLARFAHRQQHHRRADLRVLRRQPRCVPLSP